MRVSVAILILFSILTVSIMFLVIYGVSLGFHELFIKLTGKRFLYPLLLLEWVLGELFTMILIGCRYMVGKGIKVLDKGDGTTKIASMKRILLSFLGLVLILGSIFILVSYTWCLITR